MKVALVYDRINKFGGAERVLIALRRIWPEAPVFTSVYDPGGAPWADGWDIRTSWLQNIPGAKTNHESLGWLMPLAFESLDLSGFDVIISVTSEAAKGVITQPGQLHICYLLTPTRYLWSQSEKYLILLNRLVRPMALAAQMFLRKWDYLAGQRPDYIISISRLVRKRCWKYYRRESEVIYPPVMLGGREGPGGSEGLEGQYGGKRSDLGVRQGRTLSDYYLVVSRLVPYKRIDLAIEACNFLKENLVIIGSGSDEARLKAMAGPRVHFGGNLTDGELVGYYRGAKGLLMPQEEDFGLTAVEAISCGTPVISFRNSGAAEIIDNGKTGVLFDQQTAESLIESMSRFAKMKFAKQTLEKFSEEKFKQSFEKKVKKLWENL